MNCLQKDRKNTHELLMGDKGRQSVRGRQPPPPHTLLLHPPRPHLLVLPVLDVALPLRCTDRLRFQIQPASDLKSQRFRSTAISLAIPTLFSTDFEAILVAISLSPCNFLQFPNAVVLNAVGRRNKQVSAKRRK